MDHKFGTSAMVLAFLVVCVGQSGLTTFFSLFLFGSVTERYHNFVFIYYEPNILQSLTLGTALYVCEQCMRLDLNWLNISYVL